MNRAMCIYITFLAVGHEPQRLLGASVLNFCGARFSCNIGAGIWAVQGLAGGIGWWDQVLEQHGPLR